MPPILGIWASSISKAAPDTGSYFPLGEFTLTSAQAAITFDDIPQTYTHLQLRGIARTSRADVGDEIRLQLNGDTGSNYSIHQLSGDGATASSGGTANTAYIGMPSITGNNAISSTFGVAVMDILDYKNTNKYTTVRGLGGFDRNGGGYAELRSGSWRNTAAVTSIKIYAIGNLSQYTQFALFGVLA